MNITSYYDICKNDNSLRSYQQKAKEEIFESWDEVDNVMFQMPTGTGKTRLFTSIISDINKYSIHRREAVKILIIAHRTELIEQISENLKRYQIAHQIIAGGRDKNYYTPVIVASIQTITNAYNINDAKKLKVQFIIIDEAHHALAASYQKLWEMYANAKKLGVTATPWRMNHQSFLSLFDKLVLSMPIKDFIKQGYLSPYKYFSLKDDSDIQRTIEGIEIDRFGEYKESSMQEKMDIGSIRAQLLHSYLSLAKGKKGIIYAINIVHAKHICKEYEDAGYKAVSIDSKTPAAERKELVSKFRKGQIDIIVNVDIFSEGFDCPDIEFIQLARPTRSLVKYLQQVGRGLRTTENKQHCIILDNVGMYSRFGLPDARRHWNYHFVGKDVDEEPQRLSLGEGNGNQRYVDLSEGTEEMELIQDDYEGIETDKVSLTDESELFPLFGVTLGKTTLEQALKYGGKLEVDEDTGEIFCDIENIQFYYNDDILNWLFWTKDYRDFPDSWKSKGFYWENSYDAWLDVYNRLGYNIKIIEEAEQIEYDGRMTLSGSFEAKSPNGTLRFYLRFKYGEKGCFKSSPCTLYAFSVSYFEPHIEKTDDEDDEDLAAEEITEPSTAVNTFFPLFGVTLGKTTWKDAEEMGYKVHKIDGDKSRSMNVEDVDFWDNEGEGIFSSLYWTRDENDFPSLWKSKGFNWILSYDAWIEVFKKMGYNITITRNPVRNTSNKRDTLSAEFEAISPDGLLTFIMDFIDGNNGCLTSSPNTLYSITVNYNNRSAVGSSKVNLPNGKSNSEDGRNTLRDDYLMKLKHAFDKKSTSYKYFWFMALVELYKETQVERIQFRQILIKMVAKAWKYVFLLNGQFPKTDQLPFYLLKLRSITNLNSNSKESEVEDYLNKNFETQNLNTILSPLLKNVPYRFLSPWIAFSNNDDVMKQSWKKTTRCPYELYNDHIVIDISWRAFLLVYYNYIQLFIEYGLEEYLKIDQNIKEPRDFYNTRFISINQLLKGIKRRKNQEDVKQILERFSFLSSDKITPVEIFEKIPKSNFIIDSEGHKRVNIPGDMWSLKVLEKLLLGENLNFKDDSIQLFEEVGLKAYLKNLGDNTNAKNRINAKYISLNKLIKAIQINKDEKIVQLFLEKYHFSSADEITPASLMKIMPESNCFIDSEGRKRVNVPVGMWSIDILDKLLSGEKIN
ncbi:Superfamily II DNA or RNA helicase [Prevotellaceae bacterium HUN156]|nr:Superfamily II DNA or RNA helicase [Prevotellaceae bacterium HUN156]